MTAQTLKPCPFCGGQKIDGGYNEYGGFVSICENCNASGPPASEMSRDAIIEAWNTRPETDRLIAEAVAAERERLATEIAQLEQDLSDMRDNAESAYRRGYFTGGNGS